MPAFLNQVLKLSVKKMYYVFSLSLVFPLHFFCQKPEDHKPEFFAIL